MLLDPIINGSRLTFLNSHGNTYHIGDWIKDDGIFYSNEGYISWQSRYYHYDSSYYNDYSYNDEDQELRILEKLEVYEEITDSEDICYIRTIYDIVEESNGVEIYDVVGMFIKINPTASRAIRIEGDNMK